MLNRLRAAARHPKGGNAEHCVRDGPEEGLALADLAEEQGVALVCGNTVVGQWHIPGVFNDTTGPKCDANSTVEIPYINNVIKELAKKPEARRL
jgi:hypothetical protein